MFYETDASEWIDTAARIQFYSIQKDSQGVLTTTWLNAKNCADVYPYYYENSILEEEFGDFVWVCPDVQNFTLNNDVFGMSAVNSTSFGMVVNICSDATYIDDKYGLASYTKAECNSTNELLIERIVVYSKVLTVSSNPAYFEEYG